MIKLTNPLEYFLVNADKIEKEFFLSLIDELQEMDGTENITEIIKSLSENGKLAVSKSVRLGFSLTPIVEPVVANISLAQLIALIAVSFECGRAFEREQPSIKELESLFNKS